MAVIDELTILVKAEVDNAIKDLDKAEKQSDSLGKSFRDLQAVMQGPVAAAKLMVDAFGKLAKVGADLYNKFADAELSAIKLNAALDNSDTIAYGASDRLTEFADALQDVSIFESDATKGIMANLAAMGISEDQIKALISAASNLASATGQDLNSAVTQLNATLNGNAGILGKQNGAIRALTEDELKNGKAIEIIAKQYDGFAKKVGDSASGEVLQFKNTWGDTKEIIGSIVAANFKPVIAAANEALKEVNASATSGLIHARLKNKEELTTAELLTAQSGLQKIISRFTTGNNALDAKSMILIEAKTKLQAIEAALVAKQYSDSAKALETESKQKEEAAKVSAKIISDEAKAQRDKDAELQKEVDKRKEAQGWASLIAIDTENCADSQGQVRLELEKTIETSGELDKQINTISDAWGEWTVKIGDTETSLEQIAEMAGMVWTAAGEAFDAYRDLVNNQHDAELQKIEEEIEAKKEAGEDTTDLEEKLQEKKNQFAKDAFDSKKATSIADTVINGAVAAVKAFAELGPIAGPIAAALIAGMTAAQVGMIGSQQYVPMAQGGIVTSPTHALIGESGPEMVIPLRGNNRSMGGDVVINQNIGGSVVTEQYLTQKAMNAIAIANRGY